MLLLVLLSLKSLLWQCIQWNSFLNWENLKRMWEAEKYYFHCIRVQWITGIMRLQCSHMHTSLEAVCGSRHKNQSFPAVFLLSQTWRPSHGVLTNVFWPQPWHTHTHTHSQSFIVWRKTLWLYRKCEVSIVFICIVNEGAWRTSNRDGKDRNMFNLEKIWATLSNADIIPSS